MANAATRLDRFEALTKALFSIAKEEFEEDADLRGLKIVFKDWGDWRELFGTDDEDSKLRSCVRIQNEESSRFVSFGFAVARALEPRSPERAGPQIYGEIKRLAVEYQEIQFVLPFTSGMAPWRYLTIINSTDITDTRVMLRVVRDAIPIVFDD